MFHKSVLNSHKHVCLLKKVQLMFDWLSPETRGMLSQREAAI